MLEGDLVEGAAEEDEYCCRAVLHDCRVEHEQLHTEGQFYVVVDVAHA